MSEIDLEWESEMTESHCDDRLLIERALAGDGESFERLYRRHVARVFNFSYRVCLDRRLAKRATREAFETVSSRLAEAELSPADFEVFLFGAARISVLSALAHPDAHAQPSPLPPEPVTVYADPGLAAAGADHQLLIRSAVSRLSPRHRKLLALCDGAGMPCERVAQVLEEPVGATASALARARLRLGDELLIFKSAQVSVGGECARALGALASAGVDEERAVNAHVEGCPSCRGSLAAMEGARHAYRQWLDLRAPEELMRSVLAHEALIAPARHPLEALRLSSVRRLVVATAATASVLLIATTAALTPLNAADPPPVTLQEIAGAEAESGISSAAGGDSSSTSGGGSSGTEMADGSTADRVVHRTATGYYYQHVDGNAPRRGGSRRAGGKTRSGGVRANPKGKTRRPKTSSEDESRLTLLGAGRLPSVDLPSASQPSLPVPVRRPGDEEETEPPKSTTDGDEKTGTGDKKGTTGGKTAEGSQAPPPDEK